MHSDVSYCIIVTGASTCYKEVDRHFRERFTFHNLCSQHCFWAIIWFFMTLLLWMGIVFALAFHAVMTIGTILILCWVVPFFVHVFACCLFRTWVSICHINALRTCPVINLSARMPGPFARQHRHENIPI